ncbi:hypothetical protein FQN54_000864 [Arachnomyces sp. PD_36]|nr:hypothetical protein FQN54_000864 [Arachnomyces sp. PD_36]
MGDGSGMEEESGTEPKKKPEEAKLEGMELGIPVNPVSPLVEKALRTDICIPITGNASHQAQTFFLSY